jgi:TatD DNase family protein
MVELVSESTEQLQMDDLPDASAEMLPVDPILREDGSKAPLIDIGANLVSTYFEHSEMPGILKRAVEAGMTHLIITAGNYSNAENAIDVCKEFDGLHGVTLRCTAGVHPLEAKDTLNRPDGQTYIEKLENLINSEDGRKYIVAVGECGVDKKIVRTHWEDKKEQLEVFRAQLELAERVKLPVFMHCRNMSKEFLQTLREIPGSMKRVVHCWVNAEAIVFEQFLEVENLYFGLTGIISNEKKEKLLRNIVPRIPLERLMVETDSPFMVPENCGLAWRGERSNEPCMTSWVVRQIAAVREDCDSVSLAESTTKVAMEFFDLS